MLWADWYHAFGIFFLAFEAVGVVFCFIDVQGSYFLLILLTLVLVNHLEIGLQL